MHKPFWPAGEDHPSEEDLLYYVDGELKAGKAARIRAHLEACWSCRVRTEQIEETISCFVHFLDDCVGPNLAAPERGWKGLESGMARVAAEQRPRRRLYLPWPPARSAVLGALAGLAVLLLFVRFDQAPRVSASQLIRNVADTEAVRLESVVHPVLHQKLRVRRGGEAVNWEIWNDLRNRRFRQAAQHPLLRELSEVLAANRMDPRNPLSSLSYAGWREGVRRSAEQVSVMRLADGSPALRLTTEASGPFADQALIEAQLVVRQADWHPVEQRLKVQSKDGVLDYAVSETGFEVLALAGLPPTLFADLKMPAKPPLPEIPQVLPEAPREGPVPPSEAELTGAEIEATFALHRTRACLGGMIAVARKDAGVEVQGVVDSTRRREEVQAALAGVPWVRVNLQTLEEVGAASPAASPQPKAPLPPATADEIPRGKLVIRDLLGKYFEGQGKGKKIAELSNRAVSLSETALQEAWALRRLAERFAGLRIEELRPSARYALEVMIREHAEALRGKIRESQALLGPVLEKLVAERPSSGSAAEHGSALLWTESLMRLFAAVERAVGLSLSLFADTTLPPEQPENALRELREVLGRSEAQFVDLSDCLAKAFPGGPDSFTRNTPPE